MAKPSVETALINTILLKICRKLLPLLPLPSLCSLIPEETPSYPYRISVANLKRNSISLLQSR